MALAAWSTPILQGVSPGAFQAGWAGQILTLDGLNFVPGMVVRLHKAGWSGSSGEVELNADFVDDHTLTVILPSNMLPGSYDVWVEHPDGRESHLIRALMLGSELLLPLIVH